MYCLVLVNWNWLGEEVGKGTSYMQVGTYFMALVVSEKCQSQILWPLEQMEIFVALKRSKHGELYSVTCIYCVCIYVHTHTHITFVNM